jgi:hypothetical protein
MKSQFEVNDEVCFTVACHLSEFAGLAGRVIEVGILTGGNRVAGYKYTVELVGKEGLCLKVFGNEIRKIESEEK